MSINPVIVALDVPDLEQAVNLARNLRGEVGHFKVGLELFGSFGPDAVRRVAEYGPVFLDLKLHDIPTTVNRAARQLGRLGVSMLTVHALGGPAMIEAAVEGLAEGAKGQGGPTPMVLAVTVLTSMTDGDLAAVNLPSATEQVPLLAKMAATAGAPGLVCAAPDITALRGAVGDDVTLVTPGIRPAGSAKDDQARAATPAEAIAMGANHLVIGRPITRATDPVEAARAIVAEISAA